MKQITIETFCDGNGMEAARDIFRHRGIALAAAGSSACIRALYRIAEEMGKTDFLFWRVLNERDYSLGKNGQAVRACIEEALSYPEVTGVIVYASCMDILTGQTIEHVIAETENPLGVPIEVLYRGPLEKRRNPPMRKLQKIWDNWKPEKSDLPLRIKNRKKIDPPKKPHFEEIILQYASSDCDILLLTPGGCKSCIQNKEELPCRVKNTRFTDVALSTLTNEKLAEAILAAFPENRKLILVESMAVKLIGLDMEGLCSLLRDKGKKILEHTDFRHQIRDSQQ